MVALYSTYGDERITALGKSIGYEVFEFADLVAAICETAVAMIRFKILSVGKVWSYLLQSSRFA